MKVAELYALFSFKPDLSSIRQTNKAIRSVRFGLMSIAGFMGGRFLAKSMLGFNATVEDSKNQIAGMLALARKTDMADQVGNASAMYEGLRKQAAELPGTTQDYVNMLGLLVQPLANAGTSMEDMQAITVNTMIASRGLGENWQKASRDVSEFINFGKYNQVDTFIRRMLEPMGFKATDEMKKKIKKMSQEERRDIIKNAMSQKQVAQLRDAQANSYSGKMDKLKDATQQFLGKVGEPLFRAVKETVQELADWLGKNEEKVKALASSIGGVLTTAFNVIKDVIGFFVQDGDRLTALLVGLGFLAVAFGVKMAAAWIAAAGPIVGFVALISSLVLLFLKLKEHIGTVGAALVTAFAAVAIVRLIKHIRSLVLGLRAAATAAGLLSAAQAGGGVAGAAAAAGGAMGRVANTATNAATLAGSAAYPLGKGAQSVAGSAAYPLGKGAQSVGSIGQGKPMVNPTPAPSTRGSKVGGILRRAAVIGTVIEIAELTLPGLLASKEGIYQSNLKTFGYKEQDNRWAGMSVPDMMNTITINMNGSGATPEAVAAKLKEELATRERNAMARAYSNMSRHSMGPL